MLPDYLPEVDLGLTVYIFSPQSAWQLCHHPVSLFLKYSGHCLRHLLSILNSSDRFEDKNVFSGGKFLRPFQSQILFSVDFLPMQTGYLAGDSSLFLEYGEGNTPFQFEFCEPVAGLRIDHQLTFQSGKADRAVPGATQHRGWILALPPASCDLDDIT